MTVGTVRKHAPTTAPSETETGWARAQRTHDNAIRTCVPAIEDSGTPAPPPAGPDRTIVRGED